MSNSIPVGIDLGTTHTIAAIVNTFGHTEMLRDREGEHLMPSAVLFDDDRTIVGQEARLRGRAKPSRLAAYPKRDIGRPFYSHPLDGLQLPPEVVEACILNKLRISLLNPLGRDAGVVIAVPAHFNETQRQATAAAGEMAGLCVLDIVNEPVAVVAAFGEHTSLLADLIGPTRLLVFDLGGYTFEATLLEIAARTIRTIATERLPQLGGHDWDVRLADALADRFKSEHGCDPRETAKGLDQLMNLAVRAKLALSVRRRTSLLLNYGGKTASVRVTREEFEQQTADLLTQATSLCDKLLRMANWKWSDITRTFLVGGASQMPSVSHALQRKLGKEPESRVNPEEAVARGAALFAANLMELGKATGRAPQFQVANVSTHSLGILKVDPQTGRAVNKILIPRGTPLPAKITRDVVTRHGDQHSITIQVLEGESSNPAECVLLGRITIHDLPPDLSDQWPVEVTYVYDAQGRISVEARIRYTDRVVRLKTARLCGVSANHRARWKQVIMSAPGFAKYQEVNRWTHDVDAPPPIAHDAPPDESPPEEQPDSMSLVRRLMPFAFRKSAVKLSPPSSATID